MLISRFIIIFIIFFIFSINAQIPLKEELKYNKEDVYLNIPINFINEWKDMGGFQKNLEYGNKSKDIVLIKKVLNFKKKNSYFDKELRSYINEFQEATGMTVNGKFDTKTREAFNNMFLKEFCPNPSKEQLLEDELLILLDRESKLKDDFVPDSLVEISKDVNTVGLICLRQNVLDNLIEMNNQAKQDNINLYVKSGYRGPEFQELLNKSARAQIKKNKKQMLTGLAERAHSEHQLGTTIDFTSKSIGFSIEEKFDKTKEGKWLIENAHKYGFIMSYPKGKIEITGYKYEPWHYRYVGKQIAKQIKEKNITLREYLMGE